MSAVAVSQQWTEASPDEGAGTQLPTVTAPELLLARTAVEEVQRATLGALPREACGLLVGRETGGVREIMAAPVARNIAASVDRFQVHPADQLEIEREAARLGLQVLGCWHSHPRSRALPSGTDQAAALDGWSHLIAGRTPGGREELRSWRQVPGLGLVEEPLRVAPQRPR